MFYIPRRVAEFFLFLTTDIRDLWDFNHERKRDTCVACWALRKIRLICVQKTNHRYLNLTDANQGENQHWGLKDRHLIGQSVRAVIFVVLWMRSEGPTPIVFRCRTYSAPFPISIPIDSPHGLPCQMSGLQPSSITSASEIIRFNSRNLCSKNRLFRFLQKSPYAGEFRGSICSLSCVEAVQEILHHALRPSEHDETERRWEALS